MPSSRASSRGRSCAWGRRPALALISRSFRLTQQHGELQPSELGLHIGATIHPSAVLRAPDAEAREKMYRQLVDELRAFASAAGRG